MKKQSVFYLSLLLITCFSVSCNFFTVKEDGEVAAKVRDKYLYKTEVLSIIPNKVSKEDSFDITQRYINTWVKKQLMMAAASESQDINQAEIEQRIEDYKYQLMMYAFEKKYIEEHLDTVVTPEQTQEYYEANKKNFELKENIIRGKFLKIRKEAPKIDLVKKMLTEKAEENADRLQSYAYTYADYAMLSDTAWVKVEEIFFDSPLLAKITARGTPKVSVTPNSILQATDEKFVYLFKVTEFRVSDGIAPLEWKKNEIKNIIINKRMIELRDELEQKIFEKATSDKIYEIYN